MNLKNKSFISYKRNEIDITVRSDLDPKWIDSFINQFCDDKSAENRQILYDKRNTITKINDSILKKEIAVKEFHLEKTYDQLRFRLLPSKAERSLKIARALQKAGLKTPAPLAVIEKRGKTNELIFSYYVTDYVDYDFNMLDIAKDFEHPERYKIKELMPQLGKEVKRMHKANIVHNDLHAGNILVKDFETDPKLYYIDLNRGRIKEKLSEKDKIGDLKRLKFTDQEKKIFFKNYAPGKWKYYKEKVTEARQKRRKFVKTKNKIRKFLGIK
ncbi:MAG: lipopolysaccharide kinase InaA family protein [Halanaerobium sp.]